MTLTVRRRDLWALYETYMTHLTFQLSVIYKTLIFFNLLLNQKADLKAFQIIHNTIDIFLTIYPPPCCVIAGLKAALWANPPLSV